MIARIGQNLIHFPHSMHSASSINGNPFPVCDIAPTGQTDVIGQRWFCGHASEFTVSAII